MRPTATATATPADRDGPGAAAAPEGLWATTPTNDAELPKQSLKFCECGPSKFTGHCLAHRRNDLCGLTCPYAHCTSSFKVNVLVGPDSLMPHPSTNSGERIL